MTGRKITLFLNEGLPRGIREASIDQWSGRAVCGPRSKIDEIAKIPGLTGPCVYFLIGEPEEGSLLNVYVGEADPFNERIKDHLRNKDWWDQVVVFFGNNNNPDKTGIQYLETKSVSELKKGGRCVVANGNSPTLPSIAPENMPGVEHFYQNIELVLPILGFDIFAPQVDVAKVSNEQYIYCKGKGAVAKAVLLEDGKVRVLKGSTVILENAPNFNTHNYRHLKDELLKIGRLVPSQDLLTFTDDYIFNSLSAAAAVVLARSAQGPKEWKYENGKSINER